MRPNTRRNQLKNRLRQLGQDHTFSWQFVERAINHVMAKLP